MRTNPREILVYYNPSSSKDKKTIAFARTISPHVRTITHERNPSTNTHWKYILRSLDLHPKMLLNKADPEYQLKFRGKEYDHVGWLNVLRNYPHLIKSAIVLKGGQAMLIDNPTDVYRLK
jgi:arsenate reductase